MADISKIKLANGTTVTLKDAAGRADFATLLGTNTLTALGNAAWRAVASSISDGNGTIADAATVKAYVDSQVEAIPTFDVVVVAQLPTAAKDTFHKIYLLKKTESGQNKYAEYITIRSGAGTEASPYTYTWEKLGDIEVDLSGYVQKTQTIAGIDLQDNITVAELQTALGLKALAYKDKGSVTVSTADSITMDAYTPAGEVTINDLTQTPTAASLTKGDFTPSGKVTGEAIKGGSIEVTLKDQATATEAAITYSAYTPAGSVSLTKDNNGAFQVSGTVSKPDVTVDDSTKDTFVKSLKAGDVAAATFTEGKFTPASIADGFFSAGSKATYEHTGFSGGSLGKASKSAFAEEGLVASIGEGADAETLIFAAASTSNAVTEQGEFTAAVYGTDTFVANTLPSIDTTKFNGGSKAADTFSANNLPVVDGTASAVTAVTAALAAAPEFTGDKFAPAFSGTEVAELKASKVKYMKQDVNTAEFTPVAATLGFSGTKAENVLVTGVSYDKATANGASFSGTEATLTGDVNKSDKAIDVVFSANA